MAGVARRHNRSCARPGRCRAAGSGRLTAPGLFVVDAEGLAAAQVLRVRAGGEQTVEQVVQFDSARNRFVAVPIDLGPETDQVYLLLYGTGIRGRQGDVTLLMGGVEVPVIFAGPQGEFPGLDQVNVLIPRSLFGRGLVDIVLLVDGGNSNTLRVSVR
ncbi:MAG: hypothetical protein ACRD44_00740 [Bryobacteraceae bacterium]